MHEDSKNRNDEVQTLIGNKDLVVFGARNVAREVAGCLLQKPYQAQIRYFLVTDRKGNPESLFGIPVITLSEAATFLSRETTIVIAAVEKHLDSILEGLHTYGYRHTISLTFDCDLWEEVREFYFQETWKDREYPYLTLEEALQNTRPALECSTGKPEYKKRVNMPTMDMTVAKYFEESKQGKKETAPDVHLYTAKCHVDRTLREDLSRFFWEIPIQVGADLTDHRICAVCDNTGEHISEKNREYCELTALYWIWKNDRAKYCGLGHYRRHFILTPELLEQLERSDIDVVLTVPVFNLPDVRTVYELDHVVADWEVMLEAIEALVPEYRVAADTLQKGTYYHAYNMLIARWEILDEYCQWLFPILKYCEEHCEQKEDSYQNRYIGFLAERLLSIYFLHHEADYKIVHARKHFVME